jgi:hypothetical protein
MALPKLNTPTYELELPSTGEKIKYRPFLVKEQKILMMAQEGQDEKEVMSAMSELVLACTFNKVNAEQSPMFDIEYIFLRVRGKSVGEKINLEVLCPDDEKTKAPVEINLEEVNIAMTEDHNTAIGITDDVVVHFRYPYMKDMMGIPAGSTDVQKAFHILNTCIDAIHYGEDVYSRVDISQKDVDEFVDQLTTEQFEKVMKFFDTMPKLRHIVKVTNPKTKKKSEVVLEGLENFLE